MSAPGDIGSAIRLLTVLPVGKSDDRAPVAYFPLVGWFFSGAAAAIASAAVAADRSRGVSALLVAAVILACWGLLSGFLHWDGLADSADGLGVRGDAARRLAVMHDSSIGAFGVTAVVLVAMLQLTALAVVVDSGAWWGLGAPVFGRLAAALALWFRRPATPTGLAARYSGRASFSRLLVLVLPLLPLALVPFPPDPGRVAAAIAGVTVAAAVPSLFVRRIGGVNGDVLGAAILLTETFVLIVAAFAGAPA